MSRILSSSLGPLVAGCLLMACPPTPSKSCRSDSDCTATQTCDLSTGLCQNLDAGERRDGGGADAGPGLANDTCATATPVTAGSLQGTTLGAHNDLTPARSCTGYLNPGPDVTYLVSVPAGQRLTVRVTPGAPTTTDAGSLQFDPSLYFVAAPASNCDLLDADAGAVTCLAASDDANTPGTVETASWLNASGAAVDVLVVVDSSWASAEPGLGAAPAGTFSLDVTLQTPPAGETCASAQSMGAGTQLGLELTAFHDDYHSHAQLCADGDGADRAWTILVPAGQQLTLTAVPASTLDVALSLSDSASACDAVCLDGTDLNTAGGTETLTWTNTSPTMRQVYVVVDSWSGGSGTFDLSASFSTPPMDDVCGGATPLSANASLPQQTTWGYSNDYEAMMAGTGCVGVTWGPDRVYALSVPPGQRSTVTVTPLDGGFESTVNFIDAPASTCGVSPLACVGGAAFSGSDTRASYFNSGSTAHDLFAVVDGSGPGDFSLSLTTSTPPTDDVCSTTTTTLTPGTPRLGESLAGFTSDYAAGGQGCEAPRGADRVYLVKVPPGQKLSATVTPGPDAGFDAVVNLLTGSAAACDGAGRRCAASSDLGGVDFPETARWTNTTSAARDVYVMVGDYRSPSATTSYDLTTNVGPPPAGESCEVPVALTAGTLHAESLAGFSREYLFASANTSCASYRDAERVYSITLNANERLVVVGTPLVPDGGSASANDLVLNLIEGPAAHCTDSATCLASANASATSAPETLSFTNGSGASRTMLLLVAGSHDLVYDLTVTVQ